MGTNLPLIRIEIVLKAVNSVTSTFAKSLLTITTNHNSHYSGKDFHPYSHISFLDYSVSSDCIFYLQKSRGVARVNMLPYQLLQSLRILYCITLLVKNYKN